MSEAYSEVSEARRLAVLKTYPLDRADVVRQLDRIASLAAKLCDAPVGLVSLVEADRQRFLGRSGTSLEETPREHAFCNITMHAADGTVVPDARVDDRFRDNPLVTGAPGIRLYASQPLRSLEGAPLGTLCVIDDKPRAGLTDEQLGGLRTLADSAMELLERWRLDSRIKSEAARSKTAIHDLEQRFQTLADAMPQLVWSSLPDGHSDYFNRFWCEYTGAPASASHGDAWMDFLHPDDKETAQRVWREALELEGAYDLEYRLRRADGVYRWMLVRGLPMRDESGAVSRWLGTCTDIHERKAAADQHELLTRELSHRIKNIFAVISGLITLSLRRRPAIAEIGRELQQRVLALGRAHDFVRPHGAPARPYLSHGGLRGMLEILFAPYQDPHGTRLRLTGGDVRIDDRSATPLALFFHELATNSAKYGALSVDDGYVEIAIDEGDTTRLAWTEHGGPPPPAAHEPGFGASLIDMSVTRQLGGTLDYEWRPDGLRVAAAIPAAAMAR